MFSFPKCFSKIRVIKIVKRRNRIQILKYLWGWLFAWSQRSILDPRKIHMSDLWTSWSERKLWPKRNKKESMNIHDSIEMEAVSPASGFEKKKKKKGFQGEGSVQLQQQHLGPRQGLRARCASSRSLAWRFTFSLLLESFKHSIGSLIYSWNLMFHALFWQPLKNALICVAPLDSLLLWCGTDLLYNASDCNSTMVSQFTGTAWASFAYF